MHITIRTIQETEKSNLVKRGRKCFSFMESLFLSKPKDGLVVEVDGTVAGAAFLKIVTHNAIKIGYLDYIFIYPEFRGCGAAKSLYKGAIEALKAKGCTITTGVVVDDNAKSFKRFEAEGLYRTSSLDIINAIGILGLIKLNVVASGFGFGNSSAIYTDLPIKKRSLFFSIPLFLLVNAFLLFLCPLIKYSTPTDFFYSLAIIPAGLSILLISILSRGIGTKIAGGNWAFHIPQGGILTSLIIPFLGGFFPMQADFYPKDYDSSNRYQKGLGITALFEWSILLLINIFAIFTNHSSVFLECFLQIAWTLLVFHAIPSYPFDAFGFKRLWNYSKPLCLMLEAISILVIYILS